MIQFEVGAGDQALNLLRERVLHCQQTDSTDCPTSELGTLYACLGIVLAENRQDHSAAVVAFRKALSLNERIQLLPEYQTDKIRAAYREAKTGQPSTLVPAEAEAEAEAAAVNAPQSELELTPPDLPQPYEKKKRGILLLSGELAGGYLDLDLDPFNSKSGGAALLGASLTMGAMPAKRSGFTMAGRIRLGSYLGRTGGDYFGVQGALGSTVGPRKDNRFSYFLGNFGIEVLQDSSETAATFGFQGGTSIDGLQLGGSLNYVGGSYQAVMFGLELGFGGLL